MKKIVVKNENVGIRIDKFLGTTGIVASRANVQRMLEENKIKVNTKEVKPSYKLALNDIIEIEEDKPKEVNLKPQEIDLDVIYEDNDIIVINTPKGMVVHPGNGNPDGTLANAVMARCKGSLSGIGGEIRPGIVHRLDKDTSRNNYCCKKR